MAYNSLSNYYQTLYFMTKQIDFCSITEYESMIPFEREIFEALMLNEQEHQREAQIQEQIKQKAFEGL